jgi:hypothetical protein
VHGGTVNNCSKTLRAAVRGGSITRWNQMQLQMSCNKD